MNCPVCKSEMSELSTNHLYWDCPSCPKYQFDEMAAGFFIIQCKTSLKILRQIRCFPKFRAISNLEDQKIFTSFPNPGTYIHSKGKSIIHLENTFPLDSPNIHSILQTLIIFS